ncbi:MAG: AAA family ATPase [Candidatus Marinimicrobia bacterium]|nr:AAA family ATPase [Candidatus Neomarinimicrobiota bacterium]|tara:strand:- start:7786 stop:8763 length:978 start_codon:yes stop_codon:yes gene_type:complete
MNNIEKVEELFSIKSHLENEIGKVIIGQNKIINQLFIAFLCRGHVMLEGVPGLAKTLLIKTLSEAMDLNFSRIQFTPDLMPTDITGTEVLEEDTTTGKRAFKFFKGPVFANIILADEINRTPPKTQAALLEAMQENRVTANGKTYTLDQPFFVLATQNPIEQEGTYPLPEAQLDRFLFKLTIEYPSANEEVDIVKSTTGINNEKLLAIIGQKQLIQFQELIRKIPVADNVIKYAVNFVRKTRTTDDIMPKSIQKLLDWGAGPRASVGLILAAKATAVLNNRTTPDISDVQEIIKPVLRHRIIPNFNAESEGITSDDILDLILQDK